ncbi:biopolymer transporter ExbB [Endozoicomonas sp. OPT23]|uniref:MotA/TolQ/ExbB proton channel family protein n=1 Tax=Endozoicomonas sp. OPT23 TaxID=2072845 RepID=UPI00129B2153|nr:MotA/TolQ/ExbB proton channel family protein [Endozoicomonas sp. OPT23]MRI34975.1 biopolymer transporter ExbB [Endozoicomonas sp. OPT23]
MMMFYDAIDAIRRFMDSGGPVMILIAALTFILWTMICERLFYYRHSLSKELQATVQIWQQSPEHQSWQTLQIRRMLISQYQQKLNQGMPLIKTLIAVCPLLGLLGTVTGMIEVFNIMAVTGGSDAKAMAGGVSQATIPTMSGMVVALSGMFGTVWLGRIREREQERLEDSLAPSIQ